jgi:hypothetical protein
MAGSVMDVIFRMKPTSLNQLPQAIIAMKITSPRILFKTPTLTALAAGALLLCGLNARAVNYAGNGNAGFSGSVGNGTLSVTDDGTNLTFTLTPSGGSIGGGNGVALFIDNGTAGFSSTTNFNDASDGGHSVVSGYSGSGQSVLTFTNGFSPSYAISLGDSYTSLYKLANGGNGSFTYITGTGTAPLSFTINCAQIGLATNVPATIRIFGSLVSSSGYRSTEAIAGNDYALVGQGWYPFMQTAYATYNFDAPPAPAYPVAFSVDMTEQITNGAFNPGNGDTVYAAGTFQAVPWSGFLLTNNPAAANTNIYSGTYLDNNPTNTAELFKFKFHSISGNNDVFEALDNRPFTLLAPGVTNTLVYFDDLFPTNNSATTNYVTFSIDMGPQIFFGHFNPGAGDQIQVLGTFESPKWTIGTLVLTNNPASAQSNVYSGTIADGNYPGSFENYKFVIHPTSGSDNYESGNNRDFFTPTNAGTLPLAYFNNVFSIYSIPVTFQVDMTVPVLTGAFNPGAGDTVSAAGTFQTNVWTPGSFILTNDPTAANSNVYFGTYIDYNAPGTGEQYKFVTITGNGANTNYEGIANRAFILSSTAQTLPLVFWNNQDTNSILLVPTTITFTVDMNGALDVYGNAYDSGNDVVVINGDFATPAWNSYSGGIPPFFWTDSAFYYPSFSENDYGPGNPYGPNFILQNNPPGSTLYTGTFTVSAGHSFQVNYKYGIYHNTSLELTNCDNEAAPNNNHLRYIRTAGTYNFPVDIFGIQRTNPAAATEAPLGNVTIGSPSGGYLPINWAGLPSAYLQYTTNLVSTNWVNVPATTGMSSTNWPAGTGNMFFRTVWP